MEHSGDSRAIEPRAGTASTPASTATDERAVPRSWDPSATSDGPQADAPTLDRRDPRTAPTSRPGRSRAKRALDLVVVLAALPFMCVVGLLIAGIVVVTSGRPAFFVHQRVGRGGRTFGMLKFRTMHRDADAMLRSDPELWQQYVDNDFKLPPSMDSRVTPMGRFLRRASLDELPQLLNVLRGDMSLVGPRPIVPSELERYGEDGDAYMAVKPGLTGAWQVNGRSGVGYPERVGIDRDYVDSWTFWLDVKILVKTPLAVLTSRGAY